MKPSPKQGQQSETQPGKPQSLPSQNPLGQLGKLNPVETVILGIGNLLKGDDGAGPQVCSILKGKINAEVIDAGSTPENYIGKIVQISPKKLLVIDAIDFGEPPGTTRIFTTKQLQQFTFSTHCMSPHLFTQAIASEIDAEIFFIGIQPQCLQLGQGPSKQVTDAVTALAAQITSTLGSKN